MKRSNKPAPFAAAKTVRCAVYTRKSTDEGLDREFNSLDAQREAGEAYVKSQAGEGWMLIPDRYDDGGFTGGNTDRPALRRLMADVEAAKVDCVVVYKVDRLSRSLLDFARLMAAFESKGVSFVSVTQQFNTATSMGRLVLNVLLSFAQFEREVIGERTRDKIAATRRKGKWAGGHPVLGYDVDPVARKLVVNPEEADRVRTIFALYLEHGSLMPVVAELARRGWANKAVAAKDGRVRGGRPFTRTSLYKVLTNVTYAGKVRYKEEIHDGEHAAILDPDVWRRVQAALGRNGRSGGSAVRNRFGALLKGLLRCVPCGCAMTPSHTTRGGGKRYRYYVCSSAQKKGWHTCPSKSVPAGAVEDLVVGRIAAAGRDPEVLTESLATATRHDAARVAELDAERRSLERDLRAKHAELVELSADIRPDADNGPQVARLADLQAGIAAAEARLRAARDELDLCKHARINESDARSALAAFAPVWATLSPREQARAIALLVEGVGYDGAKGTLSVTFRPAGITTLAVEWGVEQHGAKR